jgi:hypothetical protein
MKGSVLFLSGIVVGSLLVSIGVAQDAGRRGVNHVGISTQRYEREKRSRFATTTARCGSRICN